MTETPRPDPWEDVGREIVGLGDLRMAERLLAVVNAARAADAARHRAEIASLRAVMTADVDRLLEQAETIRQQQARIAELEQERDTAIANVAAFSREQIAEAVADITALEKEIADREVGTAKDVAFMKRQDARITALEQALKEAQEPCYCCRETGWDGRGCRDGCKCDAALTREVETP